VARESKLRSGIVVLALIVAGFCWYVSTALTPSYHGKTADEWAEELESEDREKKSRAISALINLGPNKRTIPKLIELLQDDEEVLRQKILIALMNSSINSEEGVKPIVAAMKDNNVAVKRGCALVLASIRAAYPSVVECLRTGLSDPDMSVRRECASALGRLGKASTAAVPDLIKTCSNAEPTIRSVAASALGQIGGPAESAIPVLKKMLDAKLEVEYVRVISAHSLSKIGPEKAEVKEALLQALSFSLGPVRKGASEAIVRLKPIPVSELEELATGSHPGAALMSVKALALCGAAASDGADALVKLMESEDNRLRTEAAKALGKLGPEGVERLAKLIRSSDPRMQQLALQGFSVADDGAAGPVLLNLLRDGERQVVAHAARAISSYGEESKMALPLLLRLVESGDELTGPAAAIALAAYGRPVLPELLRLLEHENDKAKILVLDALTRMGPDAASAYPTLMKHLRSDNLNLRNRAALALCSIGPPVDQVDEVKARLTSSNLVEQWGAAVSLMNTKMDSKADLLEKPFLNILKNGDREMKISAAQFLGILGDQCRNAAPGIAELLKEEDPGLRALGVRYLPNFKMAADFIVPVLSEASKDADPKVRQAALRGFRAFPDFGDEIVSNVLPRLEDPDGATRYMSLRLLMMQEELPASTVPHLLKATGHESPDTCLQAWEVIIKHGWDTPEIASAAIEALNKTNPAIRERAIEAYLALIQKPGPAVLDRIFNMKEDADAGVRARVISNMTKFGRPPDEQRLALLDALGAKDSTVIRLALQQFVNTPALGRIPPAILTPLAEVDHFHVRIMVAEQLGRWGPEARMAIPVLRGMFDDSFMQVRRAAEKALRKIEGGGEGEGK
jgi:HEAT repeat protein